MKLFSFKEIVELTGLSRMTIARHMKTGKFPAGLVIGRKRVWPQDVFQKWVIDGVKDESAKRSK